MQAAKSCITAYDVILVLNEAFQEHGRPVCLRIDNGPERVAHAVREWLKDKQVGKHYIGPGSPWQNAYSESCNSIFRSTCLDQWLFSSLTEARVFVQQWLEEYNTVRPHGSVARMNPEQFLQCWAERTTIRQPKSLTL